METFLYINTAAELPAEVDPIELQEVEALVAEAHALEPIRTMDDLTNTGRFVVYPESKRRNKNYSEEWPVAKAKAIQRYLLPSMSLSHSATRSC